MTKEKIELTLQDESGQEYVAYPFVESEDVTLSNGMDIETMIAQDVSMPIVAHEETSFKVGVGDSDISNSIVDSSVANMTIKGQTYQNILPDPTLRNSMTDGKTMQKLNEGYESVNTVDGVCKSAILSGQTLVNLIKDGYMASSTPNPQNAIASIMPLDGSKEYTLMLNKNLVQVNIRFWYTDGSYGEDYAFSNRAESGYIKNKLRIDRANATGKTLENIQIYSVDANGEITNMMLLEGDYTNVDVPYFEGMQSVKLPVLSTTGKNLFDKNNVYENGFAISGYTKDRKGYDIKVQPNTPYAITSNGSLHYGFFNDDTQISSSYFDSNTIENKTITTPTNCNILKLGLLDKGGTADVDFNTFQLEEGSIATTHELHKSNNLTVQGTNLIIDSEANKYYVWETGRESVSGGTRYSSYRAIIQGLSKVYVKNTHSNYTFWDANMNYISGVPYVNELVANGSHEKDGVLRVPSNAKYLRFAYDTVENRGLPHVGEEIALRSLPNGVYDTLNLVTGEYVQRIGEVVFNGSETWHSATGSLDGLYERYAINLPIKSTMVLCDKIKGEEWKWWEINGSEPPREAIFGHSGLVNLNLVVKKENIEKFGSLEAYLQQNPITVQYELATPVVKTVDLSTSGNWEKVVLDGVSRVDWVYEPQFNRYYLPFSNLLKAHTYTGLIFCDNEKYTITPSHLTVQDYDYAISGYRETHTQYNDNWLYIAIKECTSKQMLLDYLSQNPITVWYQTTTNQDSTNVKEMLSFSNGHMQLSSAEGSLIPSLSYETPTSNSYQLDLAKTNTKYTIKSNSASGSFTIDGTQYNFNTNGTFTTPSTMNNKLMIANGTVADLMFIEGDVTSKTIPYFKGIKSAFEDEDKIEVLSTSKNLLSPELYVKDNVVNGVAVTVKDSVFTLNGTVTNYHDLAFTPNNDKINLKLEKGKRYRISLNHIKGSTNYSRGIAVKLTLDDGTIKWLGSDINASHLTMNGKISWIRMTPYEGDAFNDYTFTLQVEESPVPTSYEPHKSNSTKIPLLSPLRSLPNGVCDEVIVDRGNNKVKFIQRIEETTLDGKKAVVWDATLSNTIRFRQIGNKLGLKNVACMSDVLPSEANYIADYEHIYINNTDVWCFINKEKLVSYTASDILKYLKSNPITVQYELKTPVITEIDLEGFPYIYKDGHIFLDTDIVPISEITYSINQQQQIEASNEDLMRHEKKITNLHKLIGTYVNVEYESTLLALNLELK